MKSIGDRSPLFQCLATAWGVESALYPGSYVDLAPSVAIPKVTYVDTDNRAAKYFNNTDLVRSELVNRAMPGAAQQVIFHHQDYAEPLPIADASVDLLISLYAGPVWEHCRRYLVPGGLLLANASHGDASLAALDPDLELVAAVHHRSGVFRIETSELNTYLVPKRPAAAEASRIRAQGRGIAYTRPAFAYLFRLN